MEVGVQRSVNKVTSSRFTVETILGMNQQVGEKLPITEPRKCRRFTQPPVSVTYRTLPYFLNRKTHYDYMQGVGEINDTE